MNEHAEAHTVTQVSLPLVIGYFCCNIVSCVTKVANKNYVNIIYQLTLCITVSVNLKSCRETDTHSLVMFQETTVNLTKTSPSHKPIL